MHHIPRRVAVGFASLALAAGIVAAPSPKAEATIIDFGASCYTQHEIRTYNWYGPDETLQACESAELPVSQVRVPAGYKFYFRGKLRMTNDTSRAKRYTIPLQYIVYGTGRLARI